jgi:hypothetical protein
VLRQALGEDALLAGNSVVRLNPAAVWCDIQEFEHALQAGDSALLVPVADSQVLRLLRRRIHDGAPLPSSATERPPAAFPPLDLRAPLVFVLLSGFQKETVDRIARIGVTANHVSLRIDSKYPGPESTRDVDHCDALGVA